MLKQVLKTVSDERLLNMNDKVIVAVSGGPDSVALLHALYQIKEVYHLTLYVFHLNHKLRGEAADGDALYVKGLATYMGLKSYIYEADIEALAKQSKKSFEEAARDKRYELLAELMEKTNSDKIAVAQNMNDQAETILMRLFRGSGLEGLTAIKFKRDHIIRPLLNVSRDRIEAYCEQHGLQPRTDHTNFETDYTRNKIRLELLEYIKENFNPNIVEGLYQTTQLLNQDLSYIDEQVNKQYDALPKDKILLSMLDYHPAIKGRIVRKMIEDYTGSLKGITYDHVSQLLKLVEEKKHGNKFVVQNVCFEISYHHLIIYKEQTRDENLYELTFDSPFRSEKGCISIVEPTQTSNHCVYIDKQKIKGRLVVRHRMPGDRFKPFGMRGSKKLKDFFIDLKVPAKDRDDILLVCDEQNIIWVVGYRIHDDYKVTKGTKEKLYLKYED